MWSPSSHNWPTYKKFNENLSIRQTFEIDNWVVETMPIMVIVEPLAMWLIGIWKAWVCIVQEVESGAIWLQQARSRYQNECFTSATYIIEENAPWEWDKNVIERVFRSIAVV